MISLITGNSLRYSKFEKYIRHDKIQNSLSIIKCCGYSLQPLGDIVHNR